MLSILAPLLVAMNGKAGSQITLDQLPVLPRNVTVCEFSSHNKKGVNGDAEWHLYKDEHGDAVIVDVQGPGCVKSIWQTDVGGQVFHFYFDGEQKPRYSVTAIDFFKAKYPQFPGLLNSYNIVGRYAGDQAAGNSFTPMPFAKSLKVTVSGAFSFYHFMIERYPEGTPVTTFTGNENRDYLLSAFKNQGEELQPHPDEEVIRATSPGLDQDARLDLLNVSKPGTICRIVIEGDATEDFLNNVEIAGLWDDDRHEQVLAPIGMFCGDAIRPEDLRSMPANVEKLPNNRIRLTNYFRMPFWRHGQLWLVNRQAKNSGPITAEVHLRPNEYKEYDAGYFYAHYRDGRTEMGRDWLFAEGTGTGWFVGVVQTMFGMHYCEGDEHFTVDGAGMPIVNGTGTEDYYLACYWPNRNYNLPFAGCVGDIFLVPGPACYYRFHLEAPVPFYSSLDARIQHGGNSDIVSHYRSVGFYYLRKRPALTMTDMIDVGNQASEESHRYRAAGSKLTGDLDASYEGNASTTTIRDDGRDHKGGQIGFTVAIDPSNSGVRLRRRLDQNVGRQQAEVLVDGKSAGVWYHADQNPFLRWFDDDFEIPASLTEGKRKLQITLNVKSEFTDFRYEAYSYEKR
ncbi:MAG TPA: DUF2961 domain-containing protein [Fimbriimonadaceae bacterium]|nr:DUF2961 domain-containing protein [Fimbriimonadaceae bacterium]